MTGVNGKGDFETALQKLYAAQPQACGIRRETCHCPKRALLLSYRLPIPDTDEGWAAREAALAVEEMQTCGFFCATCGFSNAGTRPTNWMFGNDVP